MKITYSMYRAGEVSVYRACCERATQPYSLGGGGTICPGSRPAGVTTRCPRMVTECLPTRSMLTKMYKFTISGYVPVYVHCIYTGPDSSVGRVSAPGNGKSRVQSRAATYQSRKKWYKLLLAWHSDLLGRVRTGRPSVRIM